MKYKECKEYIKSDYYRVDGGKTNSIFRLWLATILDVGFRFMFWFRLSHVDGIAGYYPRLMVMLMRQLRGIDIAHGTKIGYGFRLVHGVPVVMNGSTVIGNNVNMCQFVTVGSLYFKAAQIGNDVYIGPNVCIVENVKIGDGATIGAGSVVVHDVPAGATVAGNPAKVISWKEPGRLVWHKWEVKD